MLKKVAMLIEPECTAKQRHFSAKLVEALQGLGLDVTVLHVNPGLPEELRKNLPELTCSFGLIEKLAGGEYLCDLLRVPHVAILTEPLPYAMDLTGSRYTILTCTDRYDAAAAKVISPKIFFLPLAVEADLASDEGRDIDVVFFGDIVDFIGLRKEWSRNLSEQFKWALEFANDILLINSSITILEALTTALEAAGSRVKFGDKTFTELYSYLEKFITGKDRFELLNAIRVSNVHVFGESARLSDRANLIFHPRASFDEKVAILRRSKICLHSIPSCRDGADESVFTALALGALPIASDSLYLNETLTHEEDVLFYKANHWDRANDWVDHFLHDEDKRKQMISSGQEKVRLHHTWDVRARELINVFSEIR